MSEKCKDCGELKETNNFRICKDCLELRGKIISGRTSGLINQDDFAKYQSALRGRTFRGPEIAKKLLGITL